MPKQNNPKFYKEIYEWVELFLQDMEFQNKASNTMLVYKRQLEYFTDYCYINSNNMTLHDINKPFIVNAVKERGNHISNTTRKLYLAILRNLFRFIEIEAENRGDKYNFRHIFDRIHIQKEFSIPEHLNTDERVIFINHIERMKRKRASYTLYRNILLCKLLLHTGIRISECLCITFDDINTLSSDTELFTIKIKAKGNDERYTYINRVLIEDELNYLQYNRTKFPNDFEKTVFITKQGRVMNRSEAYKTINNILQRAGIDKKGLHLLRHTLAMYLAYNNVDILHIGKILGHKNLNSTKIYARSTNMMASKTLKQYQR